MKLALLTIGGQWVGASNWLLQQSGENPFTDYRVDGAMNDQNQVRINLFIQLAHLV